MLRIQKTVFISYRRTDFPWARNIYQDLTHHGYDVFFDYESIGSGDFEKMILENIKARTHFIVVLTSSALERCKEPNDWLRREIETAVDEKRDIIPLMIEGFNFSDPLIAQALTGKLSELSNKNGLPIYRAYFDEGMEKLRSRYLNVALSDVPLKPLSDETQKITEALKATANASPPVKKEQLIAQEWFEQGKKNDHVNYREAIRCYTEAIRLAPNFFEAYHNRYIARQYQYDLDGAIQDHNEANRLKPTNFEIDENSASIPRNKVFFEDIQEYEDICEYYEDDLFKHESARLHWMRGAKRCEEGDFDGAIADYGEVIQLEPDFPRIYFHRGVAYRYKGDFDSAIADFDKAIELESSDFIAYWARGVLHQVKGELDSALNDFTDALFIKPDHAMVRTSLFGLLQKLGREAEAKQHEQIALVLIQKEDEYNRACFEAIRGKTDMALKLLEIGLAKTPIDKAWAQYDPDFENIRDNLRFKELVSE